MVPTLWIVLGPLGQSITAANLLGGSRPPGAARARTPPRCRPSASSTAFRSGASPCSGPASPAAITIRTAREDLPFCLTWWSFTFPVGTCVTGTNGLALHTGLIAVQVLAVLFYVGLVAAWLTVATRTFHGSVIRGILLAPPTAG